jgi:hypothetical protein
MHAPQHKEVLQVLRDANGAVLYWQVPARLEPAFMDMAMANQILFDEETDCYIHIDARKLDSGGYTLKPIGGFLRRHFANGSAGSNPSVWFVASKLSQELLDSDCKPESVCGRAIADIVRAGAALFDAHNDAHNKWESDCIDQICHAIRKQCDVIYFG